MYLFLIGKEKERLKIGRTAALGCCAVSVSERESILPAEAHQDTLD